MKGISTAILAIAVVLCQGCVSQIALRHATSTLDLTWGEMNREFLQGNGSRLYSTSSSEAFAAAQTTLRKLGMLVGQQDSATGFLYASAPAPTPLSAGEWETAKAADVQQMRAIISNEIGSLGWVATMNITGFEILMNTFVTEEGDKVKVSLALGLRDKLPPAPGGARVSVAPPTAVRIGIEKFWRTYEAELSTLVTNRVAPSEPPTKASDKQVRPNQRTKKERPKAPAASAYVQQTPESWDDPPRSLPDLPSSSADVQQAPERSAPFNLEQFSIIATGTGFIINRQGYALTNNHVVHGCTLLTTTRGMRIDPLQLVATDPRNDLALLQLPTLPVVVPSFRGERAVRSGESVVVIGYPLPGILSSEASTTTGIVSTLAGIGDDTRFFQVTAPMQPGNSGGPVLDVAGNIVGVAVAKLSALEMIKLVGALPENVNFAIKGSVAEAFLDAHGVEYRTAPSTTRMETADIAEQAEKFTFRVECRNPAVSSEASSRKTNIKLKGKRFPKRHGR